MRYQGKITDWKDERGFGFITQNASGNRVFAHISAFVDRQKRPVLDDLVTYACVMDEKRGYKAVDVQYVHGSKSTQPSQQKYTRKNKRNILLPLMMVCGIGFYGLHSVPSKPIDVLPVADVVDVQQDVAFQCQGKQYCSQMTSCEEATYYQRNCPNTQMDGDGDGVPCESQWCR